VADTLERRQLDVAMKALRRVARCDDAEAREIAWFAISIIGDMEDEHAKGKMVNRRDARD